MIQDLDGFAQWIQNENTSGRISDSESDKILYAIDIIQNAIEHYEY